MSSKLPTHQTAIGPQSFRGDYTRIPTATPSLQRPVAPPSNHGLMMRTSSGGTPPLRSSMLPSGGPQTAWGPRPSWPGPSHMQAGPMNPPPRPWGPSSGGAMPADIGTRPAAGGYSAMQPVDHSPASFAARYFARVGMPSAPPPQAMHAPTGGPGFGAPGTLRPNMPAAVHGWAAPSNNAGQATRPRPTHDELVNQLMQKIKQSRIEDGYNPNNSNAAGPVAIGMSGPGLPPRKTGGPLR